MTRSRGVCRKPTLADLLILIAAMGVGFGVTRVWVVNSQGLPRGILAALLFLTIPCVAALTLAWMVIRWRRPRPDRRRLMRQPGLFACCGFMLSASMGLSLAMAVAVLVSTPSNTMLGISAEEILWTFVPIMAGYGVLASWCLLLISGRWRRESGWIDTTGILLGLYWVVISLMGTAFEMF